MLRKAFLALCLVCSLTTARAQEANEPSRADSVLALKRATADMGFFAATFYFLLVSNHADCRDEALTDSLEDAARKLVDVTLAIKKELEKAEPDFALVNTLSVQSIATTAEVDTLRKNCDAEMDRYLEQWRSVRQLKDLGELKVGTTYRVPSEYCWKEGDLRETFEVYVKDNRRPAVKLWNAKMRDNLCIEDTATDMTEFQVIRLTEPSFKIEGDQDVYVVEVVINGKTAYLTSTIPVVAAN